MVSPPSVLSMEMNIPALCVSMQAKLYHFNSKALFPLTTLSDHEIFFSRSNLKYHNALVVRVTVVLHLHCTKTEGNTFVLFLSLSALPILEWSPTQES